MAIPWIYGLTPAAGTLIFYIGLFIHIVFADFVKRLILNMVVLLAIPVAVALFPFSPLAEGLSIGEAYIKFLSGVGFGMLLVVFIVSRGGTGAGDVKLAALLGAMLGFLTIIPGLMIGFTPCGIVGIVMLVGRFKRP